MKTLSIDVPEETDEHEVKMAVAAVLYDKCLLSAGQAAASVGISKRAFIESVGKYGVSVFSETIEDLKADIDE